MLKYIDTHSHLYLPQFDEDSETVIARAQNVLEAVVLPNIDLASIEAVWTLYDKAPSFFYPAIGLHPCSVQADFERVLAQMQADWMHRKTQGLAYYAIGETGIDLYWDKSTLDLQTEALKIQIEWAKQSGLPIILHCREALDLVIGMIEEASDERLKGVFHCFDGSLSQAQRIAQIPNFYMGLGGIITYKNSAMPSVIEQIDLKHFVLETDSPYLPPVPHRGKRNESAYTPIVAQKLAEIQGVGIKTLAQQTNENAAKLFSLT